MGSNWRKIALGSAAAVVIAGAGWSVARVVLGGTSAPRPALASMPPLASVPRSSVIVAPIGITLTAIKDALETAAPHDLSDKLDIAQIPFLADTDVSWSVSRGPLTVTAQVDGLAISTALSGAIRANVPATSSADDSFGRPGNVSGLLGNILGRLQERQSRSGLARDSAGDIHGSATLIAHPALLPQWRVEPNLASEVRIGDASLSIMGVRIRVPEAVKPLLDRTIDQQVSSLQARLRDDPFL